ncbi:MAG: lysozyme [Gemmatimonadota bacterium]|nr:lysozyme [Gemmatimonadota bacterium]
MGRDKIIWTIVVLVVLPFAIAGLMNARDKGDVLKDPIEIVKPLVRHFEGLSLEAYHDEGRLAIGYGHDLPAGTKIEDVAPISEEQAERLLDRDLAVAAYYVDRYVGSAGLDEHQKAALIDFVYNLGPGKFSMSTLRHVIVSGDLHGAPDEIRRWKYAGGEQSTDLEARREAEVRLWNGKPWNGSS